MLDKVIKPNHLPELVILSQDFDGQKYSYLYKLEWANFDVELNVIYEHDDRDSGFITGITLKPQDNCAIWNLLSCEQDETVTNIIAELLPHCDADRVEPVILNLDIELLQIELKSANKRAEYFERMYNELKNEVTA